VRILAYKLQKLNLEQEFIGKVSGDSQNNLEAGESGWKKWPELQVDHREPQPKSQ
jgi:hypothetical protein